MRTLLCATLLCLSCSSTTADIAKAQTALNQVKSICAEIKLEADSGIVKTLEDRMAAVCAAVDQVP